MAMAMLGSRIRRLGISLDALLGFRFSRQQLGHGCSASSVEALNGARPNPRPSPCPPVPAKRPVERSKHGRRWQDPYHWMRVDQKEAVEYLRQENAYAEESMADSVGLRQALEEEMAARLPHGVSSPPEQIGPWLYYTEVPEGKEYPVYCRKKSPSGKGTEGSRWRRLTASLLGWEEDEKEQVLLDQNSLVAQFGYAQLGTCRLSEDHNLLAYTVDISGNEVFTLFIKDLQTGQIMSKQRRDGVVSVEWARSGSTVFYTVADNLLRPSRIFRHSLDSNEGDILILEEKDASSFLDVSRTKDWSFITVNLNSKTSSEVYLVDAEDPAGSLQLVQGRKAGVQYFVEHHQGFLYVLTNGDLGCNISQAASGNFRLLRCPRKQLSSQDWQEVTGLEHGAFIEDMEVFEKHLVLYQRKGGLPCIQVLELPLASCLDSMRTLSLPQEVCTVIPGANEDFHSSVLRISVSSPNLPETFLEYNLASGRAEVLQQDEVVGLGQPLQKTRGAKGFLDRTQHHLADLTVKAEEVSSSDALESNFDEDVRNEFVDLSSKYICQQHQVIGMDGVAVPLTVVHSCELQKDGRNPALLIGYGAYGKPLEVDWCSERLSLLDRGWVVAFSHVRGGGELGKSWHQSGQLLKKKNSFSDLVASANFLVEEKYAHKSKLGALGISAGGLLVAGAVNLHPSLFQAVVLQVPFLDISNTLLDRDLPLSVHEYDEWGDPDDPEAFAYISSYSPYDNVQVGTAYPAMLVKAGFRDTRVGYWEAAKWVAKVRDSSQEISSKLILLKTSMDTGHFGDGGRFGHLGETAYDYAFLIKMMGS